MAPQQWCSRKAVPFPFHVDEGWARIADGGNGLAQHSKLMRMLAGFETRRPPVRLWSRIRGRKSAGIRIKDPCYPNLRVQGSVNSPSAMFTFYLVLKCNLYYYHNLVCTRFLSSMSSSGYYICICICIVWGNTNQPESIPSNGARARLYQSLMTV